MRVARAVQVSRPSGPFELVEREIPEPGPRQVRIKVQACGLCHSDSLTKEGHWPGIKYPRVPGHEIAGVTLLDPTFRGGSLGSASASGGSAATADTANRADAAASSPVPINSSRASPWMAGIRTTFWCRSKDWLSSRTS